MFQVETVSPWNILFNQKTYTIMKVSKTPINRWDEYEEDVALDKKGKALHAGWILLCVIALGVVVYLTIKLF